MHAGGQPAGKSFAEKDLGVLVNNKLNLSLAVKKADIFLGCIRQSIVSGLREVIFHL